MSVEKPVGEHVPQRPHLRKNGDVWQLYVHGRPKLLYGGEVHNSSASSREWMKPIWEGAEAAHFNVMLAPVSWDLFEPEEGQFDFTQIDELIADAREHHMHLIPLWFGSWKNGATHYAPLWVKADTERFPRVRTQYGNAEVLSPLSQETLDADTRAFTALMGRIRELDAQVNTVLMVQIQNEVGIHGDSRDRSPQAEAAFAGQVPAALIDSLVRDEAKLLPPYAAALEIQAAQRHVDGSFRRRRRCRRGVHAWHYALFCNHQAELGKAEYELPMFVNPWLKRPFHLGPGQGYPSGGPVIHMQDIWRAGAPAIDIIAPDIHTAEVETAVMGSFTTTIRCSFPNPATRRRAPQSPTTPSERLFRVFTLWV